MAKDPPIITAALAAALPNSKVRDRKALDKLLQVGTANQGAGIDEPDRNGDTAVVRLARRALAGRVAHWLSEGHIGNDPVSYTITDGVMVFRKRGRVVAMNEGSEDLFAQKWCPEHYAFLRDLYGISNLLANGASLTIKGKDKKTVRQHLDALKHPRIEQMIADYPKEQRKLARRISGLQRREAKKTSKKR